MMTTNNMLIHRPVLLNEVIKQMAIYPSGTYVDCTAGFAGHSQAILNLLNDKGKLICIDCDKNSIDFLYTKFKNDKRVIIVHDNFANIKNILKNLHISQINGLLADLGASSLMFDDKQRGFSYFGNNTLDMRMNQNQTFSAIDVINTYDEKQLKKMFIEYGEIKNPSLLIKNIIITRKNHKITKSDELVDLIKKSINKIDLYKKKHPATKYFQAIRMEVNNEIINLQTLLKDCADFIKKGGRILIITFHSLEDRTVKQFFNKLISSKIPKEVPIMNENISFRLINKKYIQPSQNEIATNNRSRSAKMRGVIKN